jgi:hypothetical protein
MALSDVHIVIEAALKLTRDPNVLSAEPSPAPWTVTSTDPVDSIFALLIKLTAASETEYAALALPTCCPIVTPALLDPRTACASLQSADVSDNHLLASQPLPPVSTLPDCVECPRPDPCKQRLMDPVDALLA